MSAEYGNESDEDWLLRRRNAAIVRARTVGGLTYTEISARYGVSRQRIHQIVKRAVDRGLAPVR